jgi:serine/threonine protein phosphatase PrpC/Na+-transporting methylmalonyl-CoA/oxaloacetate decarboxylase gamma subunit
MSQSPAPSLVVNVAMETHIGRQRQQNQDAIGHLVPPDPAVLDELGQIFVLADGVGGLKGGDLASQYALSTIISSYYDQTEGTPADRLARAIAEANNVIYDEGQAQDTTMATTIVAAVVRGHDLIIGSVGDSPAFLIREGRPRKLTLDHTVAALSDTTPGMEGSGHKLVRALGVAASVKVDIITGRVRDGDCVVLCSDGLTRYVLPEEIERVTTDLPLEDATKTLIEMANERGGADNISLIVLRLVNEEIAQLPALDDPMLGWGRPRRSERTRAQTPPVRVGSRIKPAGERAEPADNPLRDLWRLLRGNAMLTAAGMAVLLVIFVIIMLVIANSGGEDQSAKNAVATESAQRTATAVLIDEITAEAAAAQTTDAIQAATAAEDARLTLTPPTPIPTSGPQMSEGIWFRVLDGDPIPAYRDVNGAGATPLEAGSTYRVMGVDHNAKNGPWYQVVDNLGQESRWVSGPSLHERIVAIDASGNPLPAQEQPLDVPLPGNVTPATPGPQGTPVPFTGTPGTPGTPPPNPLTPSATSHPSIPYGKESWIAGDQVTTKDQLDLCRVPDVTACDMGSVVAGEIGTVVEGPVAAGDHWWWQVEFEDGRTGWVAQVLLDSAPEGQ